MVMTYVYQRGEGSDIVQAYFDRFPKIETIVVSDKPPTKNDFRYERGIGKTEGRSVYLYYHTKTKVLSRVVPVVNP